MKYLTFENAIGLLAFALNVWGNLELTRMSARGWYVRIAAIICWGIYGLAAASIPNMVNAATFFCLNVWGAMKWHRLQKANGLPRSNHSPGRLR